MTQLPGNKTAQLQKYEHETDKYRFQQSFIYKTIKYNFICQKIELTHHFKQQRMENYFPVFRIPSFRTPVFTASIQKIIDRYEINA